METIYSVVTRYGLFFFKSRDSAFAFSARINLGVSGNLNYETVYSDSDLAYNEYNHMKRMDEMDKSVSL